MVTNYVSANCELAFAVSKLLGSELPSLLQHRGYMHRLLVVAPTEEPLRKLSDEMLNARGERVILPVVADVTTDAGRATIAESVRCSLQTSSASTSKSYVAHVVYFTEMLCNAEAMSQYTRTGQCSATYQITGPNLRESMSLNAEAPVLLTGALHAQGLIQLLKPEMKQVTPRTRLLVTTSGEAVNKGSQSVLSGFPMYSIAKAALYAAYRQMLAEGCLVSTAVPEVQCEAATYSSVAIERADPAVPASFVRAILIELSDEEFLNNGEEWNIEADAEKLIPKPPASLNDNAPMSVHRKEAPRDPVDLVDTFFVFKDGL